MSVVKAVCKNPLPVIALLLCTVMGSSAVVPVVFAQSDDSASRGFSRASAAVRFETSPASVLSARNPSGPKAFALSLLLPGLGQRYVDSGKWGGWATTFALADAGLWLSLFGSEWHRNHLIDSYTSLAAMGANADVLDKNRSFFLNLATYRSSDEFLEVVLRNRAWNQIGYVDDPSYQWNWSSDEDFSRYRTLREDAESLRRRRTVIIVSLVANRILSGVMAAWKASKVNRGNMAIQLAPPPMYSNLPQALFRLQF